MSTEHIAREDGRGNSDRLIYWVLAAGVWLCALGILLLSYDIWYFMFRV